MLDQSNINDDQYDAIVRYARTHGRTWKSQLLSDWMTGRTQGELQQLRNSHGPRWLKKFKLPAVERASLDRAVRWVAANDESAELDLDTIENSISVLLVADLFNKLPRAVAVRVRAYRRAWAKCDAIDEAMANRRDA